MVSRENKKLGQAIFTTTDYDKFKRLEGNRFYESHVRQLVEAMREHDLHHLDPIVVNENMEIVDGQHRLEARRRLEREVYYIIGENLGLRDVQILNSTSKLWLPDDYARSYVARGNKHYVKYSEFRNRYGLSHDVSMLLLSGRGPKATRRDFRLGDFRVFDLHGAEAMANILQNQIRQIWPAGWRDSSFVRALYIAQGRVGFSMERFLSALEANKHFLSVMRSVDSYLAMIENIYNAAPGKKVAIRFGLSVPDAEPSKPRKVEG